MPPGFLFIHPFGNPNATNAAQSLLDAGLLDGIATTYIYKPNGILERLIELCPSKIREKFTKELKRRTWLGLEHAETYIFPTYEILRVIFHRLGFLSTPLLRDQKFTDCVVYHLDKQAAQLINSKSLLGVFGYEDCSAISFQRAKHKGLSCIYELPTFYHLKAKEILCEEANLFPELTTSMYALKESKSKIKRKEVEINLADHIIVASSNIRSSLTEFGIPASKISIIPYGVSLDFFTPAKNPGATDSFRILYVGRINPNKGVHYLLDAWKRLKLKNAELVLVGINEMPRGWLNTQQNQSIRHISWLTHPLLRDLYQSSNVVVLPSLVEGFGLVILEAMACEVPVIATSNTAAPDIFTDGKEGFIIPPRDSEILSDKLNWCYHHRKDLLQMGQKARQRAEEFSWSVYRKSLVNKLLELCNCSKD